MLYGCVGVASLKGNRSPCLLVRVQIENCTLTGAGACCGGKCTFSITTTTPNGKAAIIDSETPIEPAPPGLEILEIKNRHQ